MVDFKSLPNSLIVETKFNTEQDTFQNLLVWVYVPCLPIEYYDHNFLMRLGSKLGKPVRIDDVTNTLSKWHFACIYAEVDLSKPLVSKFKLRRRVRRLEYQGIHFFFVCGMIETCPLEKQNVEVALTPSDENNTRDGTCCFCDPNLVMGLYPTRRPGATFVKKKKLRKKKGICCGSRGWVVKPRLVAHN